MSGKNGCEVNRTGTLCCVEAPNTLDRVGIHIHCFRTVAPAGSNGKSYRNALFLKLLGAGGCLGNTADSRVGNYDLDRLAVGISEVFLKELLCSLGHSHCLILKGFSDLERASSCVNDGTDTDYGIFAQISVFCHIKFILSLNYLFFM